MQSTTGERISVTIKLHSVLRTLETTEPRSRVLLELAPGSTVATVVATLKIPEMDIVYVLNESVVESTALLHAGDTLALIPALEGGCCAQLGKTEVQPINTVLNIRRMS